MEEMLRMSTPARSYSYLGELFTAAPIEDPMVQRRRWFWSKSWREPKTNATICLIAIASISPAPWCGAMQLGITFGRLPAGSVDDGMISNVGRQSAKRKKLSPAPPRRLDAAWAA